MSPYLAVAGGSAALAAGLYALGWWEMRGLRLSRASVPVRIHVNGTRGKSSVVRLLMAGLWEAAWPAVGKTTGAAPRILHDGTEAEIVRGGRPSVREQVGFVRLAARLEARALVAECMAIRPELQAVSEVGMLRSTHGVITGAGPDHLEIMGPTVAQVASALAGTVPVGGKVFSPEGPHLAAVEMAARDRRTALVPIGMPAVEEAAGLSGFPHREHPVNIALALAVLEDLGIERAVAVRGMLTRLLADPGATTTHRFFRGGDEVVFVNAFGANDPKSSGMAWVQALRDHGSFDWTMMAVSCRRDRPGRTEDLFRAAVEWPRATRYGALGPDAARFERRCRRNGWPCVRPARGEPPGRWPELLMADLRGRGLIVGLGNSSQGGFELADAVRALEPAA